MYYYKTMRDYKNDCGCKKHEDKCPEDEVLGCLVQLSTDCIRWDVKNGEEFLNQQTLTEIIKQMQERIKNLEEVE